MEGIVNFDFRGQPCRANFLISEEVFPTYIYIWFSDAEMIREFGEEVCIHTDGNRLLPHHIYSESRLELFQAIFEEAKKTGLLSENKNSLL